MVRKATNRAGWKLVRNPGWNVVPEEPFTQSACHDFSHFVTVQCACGEQMHMHQTAWEQVPATVGIASKCHGCGKVLEFPPSYFQGALDAMREGGWIA